MMKSEKKNQRIDPASTGELQRRRRRVDPIDNDGLGLVSSSHTYKSGASPRRHEHAVANSPQGHLEHRAWRFKRGNMAGVESILDIDVHIGIENVGMSRVGGRYG